MLLSTRFAAKTRKGAAHVAVRPKRQGATMMEYLMMISLILVVALVGIGALGTSNSANMSNSSNLINNSLKKGS
jgi:Tfp pilus assembly protein FimT